MLGVTTFEGEEDDELLDEILTGVVDPDRREGDFEADDVLLEYPVAKPCDVKQDAHCHPEVMSLSLITGL